MPKSPKSAPPRSNLTLEQHWQIIQYKKEHPTLSTAEIARVFAEKFNHPTLNQSTVSRTLNKEDRLRPFSTHTTRKKISQVRCPEVEEALMKWYSLEIEQGNIVTGPMLRNQAIKIADEMGIPEDQRPKYSNGWLDCYKSRHQLKFGNRPQAQSQNQSHSTLVVSTPVPIQPRPAAQHQQQQSQVQVPPHLHRPSPLATTAPTSSIPPHRPSISTSSLSPPLYSSPPLHMKSEPSEPDMDHRDADADEDIDVDTDSDVSGSNSYPSRSPSCCSYGYPAYTYNSYPYTSHSHSHRHSHSYPSYTSACSACTPPPHHLPHYTHQYPSQPQPQTQSPSQPEDEISRAVKSLKLHLESCPTLAPNRNNLLANMKVIECAVSDCRSSIGGDDDEEEESRSAAAVGVVNGGRMVGGVVIPRSSHEPLSPISTTVESISTLELREARHQQQLQQREPEQSHRDRSVSVPPRRQRWLDLVTSPTDSDYSNSNSISNPGSVSGSPAGH